MKRKFVIFISCLIFTLTIAGVAFAQNAIFDDVSLTGDKTSDGTYTSEIEVSYNLEDTDGIKEVRFLLNGKKVLEKDYSHDTEGKELEELLTSVKDKTVLTKEILSENEPEDYTYKLIIRSVDKDGNFSDSETEFTANASMPQIEYDGVEQDGKYKEEKTAKLIMSDKNPDDVTFAITAKKNSEIVEEGIIPNETGSKMDILTKEGDLKYEITEKGKYIYEFKAEEEGLYEISITGTDKAGNTYTLPLFFTIDNTAPAMEELTVTGSNKGKDLWYDSYVNIGSKIKDEGYISKIKITVNDNFIDEYVGIDKKEYEMYLEKLVDEKWFTENETKDGKYTVKVTVSDAAGNETEKTAEFYADVKAPELTLEGIEDGASVNTAPVIKVTNSDNHIEQGTIFFTVKKDGEIYKETSVKEKTFTFDEIEEEGAYEVTAYSTDAAGNSSEEKKVSFVYDTTAPKVKDPAFSGHINEGYDWFNETLKVSVTGTDAGSGVNKVSIKVNGVLVVEEMNDKGLEEPHVSKLLDAEWFAANESEDGKYTAVFSVVDNAGNEYSSEGSVYADVVIPVVELSGIDNGAITNEAPVITVTNKDNYPKDGKISLTITRDGKEYKKEEIAGEKMVFSGFEEDGEYTVSAVSTDKAGNISEKKEISFIYDTTGPAVEPLKFDGEKEAGFDWFKGDVSLQTSAEDKYSGITAVSIAVNGKEVSGQITDRPLKEKNIEKLFTKEWLEKNESVDGKYETIVTVFDEAGNKTSEAGTFNADVSAPAVTITGIKEGTKTNEKPEITVTNNDNYAADSTISLTVTKDGKEYKTIKQKGESLSFADFEENGAYEVKAYVTDMAGNVSGEAKVSFIYDTESASIEDIQVKGDKNENSDWYCGDVSVSAAVEDTLSGLADITAFVNDVKVYGPEITKIKEEVIFVIDKEWLSANESKDGNYIIKITATDAAGNVSEKETAFTADVKAPEVSISGVEAGANLNTVPVITVTNKDNYVSDNTIHLTVTRDGEPYDKAEAKGEILSYENFKENGNYSLTAHSVDKAGNISEIQTIAFIYDTQGPGMTELKVKGKKNEGTDWYCAGVSVTSHITDNYSGVKTLLLTVNDEVVYQSSCDKPALDLLETGAILDKKWFAENESSDGLYKAVYKTTDYAGNETTIEGSFHVDIKAPTVEITDLTDGTVTNKVKAAVVKFEDNYMKQTTVKATVTKDGEVYDKLTATGEYIVYDSYKEDGRYEITAIAEDAAGNRSEENKISFIYDTAAAEMSDISFSGEIKDGASWYSGDVEVSALAKDEYAGLSITSMQVNGKDVEFTESRDSDFTSEIKAVISKEWMTENESEDGKYNVVIKVKDKAGNLVIKSGIFEADVKTPAISITGIKEGAITNEKPVLTFTNDDNYSDYNTFYIDVTRNGEVYGSKNASGQIATYDNFREDGKYTVTAYAVDKAGNTSEVQQVSFIYDVNAPLISDIIIAGDKNDGFDWFKSDVSFEAAIEETYAGIKSAAVKVNGKELAFTEGEDEFDRLISARMDKKWFEENESEDGKYEFEITAIDKAGNTSSQTAVFEADVKTPAISITGIKEGAITNKAPVITVTNTDNYAEKGEITLKVSRDGEEYAEITKAGSSMTYDGFKDDGKYELSAVSVDKAGNVSAAVTRSFIYDTKAPALEGITFEGDKREGYSWFHKNVTIKSSAKDEYAGISHIDIKVNDKQVTDKEITEDILDKDISRLLERSWFTNNENEAGKYEVVLTVTDKAGNESISTKAFYADVTVPKVALSGIDEGSFLNMTPTVKADVTDNYAAKNTIFLDIDRNDKDHGSKEKTAASYEYSGFNKDGDYAITAKAVDKAGNTSKAAVLHFTKDTVAPSLTLSGAEEDSYTTGSKDIKVTVKERNYSNATVKASIVKELDGKRSEISFGQIKPDKKDYSQIKKLTETGTYTVTVTAVDKAGNEAAEKDLSFTIDNDKPIVEIKGIGKQSGYGATIAPVITYEDSYFKDKEISVTRADGKEAKVSFKDTETEKGGTRTYANIKKIASNDGVYTVTCTVTDKAGNKETKSETFSVNRFGSVYKMDKKDKSLKGRYLNDMPRDIVITELNVTGLAEYEAAVTKDGITTEVDLEVEKGTEGGWKAYDYIFHKELFSDEGSYSLNVSSTDNSGNLSEYTENNDQFTFYVDKTAPTISISGIEEGKSYEGNEAKAIVSVSDSMYLEGFTVYSNDKVIYSSDKDDDPQMTEEITLPGGINQTVKVVAKDKAGNISEESIADITVSGNFLVRLWANKALFFGILFALAAAAAGCTLFAVNRRKKDSEAA